MASVTYLERRENFRLTLEMMLHDYRMKHHPSLALQSVEIVEGRKYDKVVVVDGGRSAYCWIDRETGALMKGNWKKVEDKRPRGNIFNSNPMIGCNPYGIDYLKIENYKF